MDPVKTADAAAKVVVDYGTLGAVMLGASLAVGGLVVAVVFLWRAREAAERKREEAQQKHYAWAVEVTERQAERERKLTEALQLHAAATTTVRDLLAKVLERMADGAR